MGLELMMPPLTERQRRHAEWLRRHTIIPEERTLYFGGLDSSRRTFNEELERAGETPETLAGKTGLDVGELRRLAETGACRMTVMLKAFQYFHITCLSVPPEALC